MAPATTSCAAKILRVSRRRVTQLIALSRIPATMTESGWRIAHEDLLRFKPLAGGRPKGRALS